MKKKDAKEMEEDMKNNPDEYVGTIITIAGGMKCLFLGLEENGIRSLPVDLFVNMKKKDLEGRLKEILPAEKVGIALEGIKKIQNHRNEIYV